MENWWIAATAGIALVIMGSFMLYSHWVTWQNQRAEEMDEGDRHHYRKRFRRRMQTSSAIVLVGILIPLGDFVIPWQRLQNGPHLFALYWGGVLLVTMWVILMALGDMTSTKLHSQSALASHRARVRELEEQVSKLRSKSSNGQHHATD